MNRFGQFVLTAGWLSLLAGGFAALHDRDAVPGSSGLVPDALPAQDAAELVLFVHPKCPCMGASLAALAELDASERRGLEVRVVFVGPAWADEAWWAGDNWAAAGGIPGARVERDAGGVVARAFGVRTSGHAVARAADGRVQFSGGVPPRSEWSELWPAARGATRRPVRGCPLFDE